MITDDEGWSRGTPKLGNPAIIFACFQSFSQLISLWPPLSCNSLQSLFLLYTPAILSYFTPSERPNHLYLGDFVLPFLLPENPFLHFSVVASLTSFCFSSNVMSPTDLPHLCLPSVFHITPFIDFVLVCMSWLLPPDYKLRGQRPSDLCTAFPSTWAMRVFWKHLQIAWLLGQPCWGHLLFSPMAESGTGVILGSGLLTGTRWPWCIYYEL